MGGVGEWKEIVAAVVNDGVRPQWTVRGDDDEGADVQRDVVAAIAGGGDVGGDVGISLLVVAVAAGVAAKVDGAAVVAVVGVGGAPVTVVANRLQCAAARVIAVAVVVVAEVLPPRQDGAVGH